MLRTILVTFFSLFTLLSFTPVQAAGLPSVNDPDSRIINQPFFRSCGDAANASKCQLNGVLNTLIGKITTAIFAAITAMAVLYIMYAGIQYITAGGSPEKAKKARQQIINIIFGLILFSSAYVIIIVLLSFVSKLAGAF